MRTKNKFSVKVLKTILFIILLFIGLSLTVLAANLSVTNISAKVSGTSVTLTAMTTTGSSSANGYFDPTWEIGFDDGYDTGTLSGSRKYISNGKTFSDTFSNRQYGYFWARCMTKNDWGETSSWSSRVYFEITPPTPTSLSVSSITQTSANLSWAFSGGSVQGYRVEVRGSSGNLVKSENVSSKNYNVTGLSPETNYYFRVYAYSHGAESAWSNNSSFSTAATTVTTYTITYNANSGSGAPTAQTKTQNVTLTLSNTIPTRSGYIFLGWATSSTATSAQYQSGGNYTNNASIILYAVWQSNNTTAPIISDGTYYLKNRVSSDKYIHIQYASKSQGAALVLYQGNSGWNTQYTFTRQSDGTYKITNPTTGLVVDAFGGTCTAYDVIGFWDWHGGDNQRWNIESTSAGYRIRPKGNNSQCWSILGNSSANDSGIILYPADGSSGQYFDLVPVTATVPEAYTVNYNANGGSGAPTSQVKTHNVNLTLNSTKPTRSGYDFLGWATSSTAVTAIYQPSGIYTANTSVTLYAVWKVNTIIPNTPPSGENIINAVSTTLFGDSCIVKDSTLGNFVGWIRGPFSGLKFNYNSPVAGNATLKITYRSDRRGGILKVNGVAQNVEYLDTGWNWSVKNVDVRFNAGNNTIELTGGHLTDYAPDFQRIEIVQSSVGGNDGTTSLQPSISNLSYTRTQGKYIFINNPEWISASQLIDYDKGNNYTFKGDVSASDGRTQVYFEHVNPSGYNIKYGIMFFNPSGSTIRLTTYNRGASVGDHKGNDTWRGFFNTNNSATGYYDIPARGVQWFTLGYTNGAYTIIDGYGNATSLGYKEFDGVLVFEVSSGSLEVCVGAFNDINKVNGTSQQTTGLEPAGTVPGWNGTRLGEKTVTGVFANRPYNTANLTFYLSTARNGFLPVNSTLTEWSTSTATAPDVLGNITLSNGRSYAPGSEWWGNWGVINHHNLVFYNDTTTTKTIKYQAKNFSSDGRMSFLTNGVYSFYDSNIHSSYVTVFEYRIAPGGRLDVSLDFVMAGMSTANNLHRIIVE